MGGRRSTAGVAIVGTGFGVGVHLPAFAACPDFEVVALCGARLERTQRIAEREGVPVASNDFATVVAREDVDLVAVSTPPGLHADVVAAALSAGKHVLCEKPMTLTVSTAAELTDTARRSGVIHAMGFEWRFRAARRHVRRLVHSGVLGEPRFVSVTSFTDYATDPRREPYWHTWVAERRAGGGLLHGLLSHHLDQIRFLFGELYGVSGTAATAITSKPVPGWDYRDGDELSADSPVAEMRTSDADDCIIVSGRLGNGALVNLSASWAVHGGSGTRMEAYGSEGSLVLDENLTVMVRRVGDDDYVPVPLPADLRPSGAEDNIGMFTGLVAELGRAVKRELPVSDRTYADLTDGLRVQQISEEVLGDVSA
jgi:predicted dehydrogenase